jgi:hypothetical protein
MSSSKKKVVELVPTKKTMVNLFKTNYHYYRHWVKYILSEGKIKAFRFVKDEVGWTGKIAIDKPEVDTAKKVLSDYKVKNPNTTNMWW